MTHVSTIKTNTQTMTPEALQEAIRNGSIDSTKITDISVFNQSADPSACTDGEDDGKIGIFDAIGSTIKGAVEGVVNGIKGCFFDENGNFSLGNTLKTALTVGACFIPGVGPIVATGLCAYGAVKGGIGVAKGVAAAATAETDAEAKAAFESIGANGVATAASAVGLKASASALASNVTGSATGSTLKNIASVKDAVVKSVKTGNGITGKLTSAADTLTGGYYGSAWGSATGSTAEKLGQVASQTAKQTGQNVVAAGKALKQTAQNKIDKLTGKTGTGTAEQIAKKLTTKDNKVNASDIKAGSEVKVGDKTYEITSSGDKLTYKLKNNTTNIYSSSETSKVADVKSEPLSADDLTKVSSLDEGASYTTADGTVYKMTKDGLTKTTGATKTTIIDDIAENQLKSKVGKDVANELIDNAAINKANGVTGDVMATGKNGTQYFYNPSDKSLTISKNISNLEYNIGNIEAGQYATYTNAAGKSVSTVAAGQPKAAAWTLASTKTGSAADEIENQIPLASQTLANVGIQSGVEYDLQDYTIMDEDQVNESYSQIMSNAYGL